MSSTKPSDDGGTTEEPSKSKEKSRKVASTKTTAQPKRRNSTVNFNTQVLVGVAPHYDRKIAVRTKTAMNKRQKNIQADWTKISGGEKQRIHLELNSYKAMVFHVFLPK